MRIVIIFSAMIFVFGCTDSKNSSDKTTTNEGIFEWEDGLCVIKGTYDQSKYTKEELENTLGLIMEREGLGDVINYFDNKDFKPSSKDTISNQFNRVLMRLKSLQIVKENNKYWEDLRQQRINELQAEYNLKEITIEAYTNPSILLKNEFSDSCSIYASALATEDTSTILSAWRYLHQEQLKQSGAPELLEKKFVDKYNSPEKLKYAKRELMVSGWWNCANHQILHITQTEDMNKEFDKLFLKVESDCLE